MFKLYRKLQRHAAISALGGCLLLPGFLRCNFDEATVTASLDTRDVVSDLIISSIINPLEVWVTEGVDRLFDQLSDEEED
jgi:hypothetical protein